MYKGHIPESVIYVCAKSEKTQLFDDEGEIAITEERTVTPTFCIESTQNPDTAIRWTGMAKPKQILRENKPMKKIEIVGLEERGNGGRAYKVIVEGGHYFDLREDVLLESMIELGIDKGGFLRGEYVWAKYGNGMKIVRVGSPLHDILSKGNIIHNAKQIKKTDLVIGGIYSTKTQQLLFLGDYNTFTFKQDENPKARGYFSDTSEPYHINKRLVKEKIELYLEIPEWLVKKGDFTKLTIAQIKKELGYYYFKLNKSTPKFLMHNHTMNVDGFDFKGYIYDNLKKSHKDVKSMSQSYANLLNISAEPDYIHPEVKKLNITIAKK